MQRWTNARNIGFTILVWIVIVFIIAWTIGHFITAVILFVIAALLAYAISPGVTLLRRLPSAQSCSILAALPSRRWLPSPKHFLIYYGRQSQIIPRPCSACSSRWG
jgi:hypothetical protein